MKKMMLGLFFLLLSIWCLIFGVVDDAGLFSFVGVLLPIVAIIVFLIGFFQKENEK